MIKRTSMFVGTSTFKRTNTISHLIVSKNINGKTFVMSERTYFNVLLNAGFF
jgi:hypothetical protein